ncbi:MAG TPA: cytochrome d ubiquinol oxidase subunit II [Acidiferrobacterales bacterium]|nr:cytochrome d ubiquinol oxidase subunit II [Acidiferrobacterales bacterium]
MDLTLVSTAIIAFGIAMYIILDGFDLGIGILFLWAANERERDIMMNSVAPVWDGNETWLVLGGSVLFGAFPVAYGLIMPAIYLPMIVFLFALIFRGVAFEFRFKSRNRTWWNLSFSAGSTLATFAQGLILGSFIQGYPIAGKQYAGGAFEWLTPFSVMAGVALVAGYALLGATWLILKTEGPLQEWCYRAARGLMLVVLLFIGLVSVWTPLRYPEIAARWFGWPNILYLSPVPIVTALVAFLLWQALRNRSVRAPFPLSIGLFMLSYLGLGVSLWPYIVPRVLTIRQAAAPVETQGFLLIGVALFLPLVLIYTVFTYWVFRGKVSHTEGYH